MSESIQDRLMNRIKKQTIFRTIKEFLRRNPKLGFLPLVIKDVADNLKEQTEEYLGNADKVVVIGRRNGETRIFIIDGNKNFTLTTGLKLKVDKDALIMNQRLDQYVQEYVYDSGILEGITEEQKQKYEEMKSGGSGITDLLKGIKINDQTIDVPHIELPAGEQKPEQPQT